MKTFVTAKNEAYQNLN